MYKPCIRTRIARRVHCFFAPLQESLRIREGAFLFGVTSRGEEKNFSLNLFGLQFPALDLGRLAPEICRFNLNHIADDQPFQFCQRLALEARIGRANYWVLPHQKHPFHLPIEHVVKKFEEGMVAGKFGKETVAEIVFHSRVLPVVSLKRADQVFRVVCPETGFFCVMFEILLKGCVSLAWHCEVAGKNVIKRRNIGRPLD